MPRLVDASRAKFRYQLAAGLVVIAIALGIIAFRFETESYLISTPQRSDLQVTYQNIWFTSQDALVGARRDGTHLKIQRWDPGSNNGPVWDVDLTGAPADLDRQLWTAADDLSHIAWIGRDKLYSQQLAADGSLAGEPLAVPLPPRRHPLAVSILTDATLAAVFDDASVARWAATGGRLLGKQPLRAGPATQAVAAGDYVAITSGTDFSAGLYHYQDEGWSLVETAPPLPRAYQLVMPAPGVLATLSDGVLRIGGEVRNTPGRVLSVSSHVGSAIVTGEFERALVVLKDAEFYDLSPAAPGSRAAVGRDLLAITGPGGTAIFKLGHEGRLTVAGRRMAWIILGLIVFAGVLVLGPFLLNRLLSLFEFFLRGKDKPHGGRLVPKKLASPPRPLLQACADGEAVLWAGAGLSAQAGIPARRTFAANLLQVAMVEHWIDQKQARKLVGQVATGDAEDVLDELAALGGSMQSQLIVYVQSAAPRYLALSRSHELLERIPFRAAITTNYDALLERVPASWNHPVVTLRSPGLQQTTGASHLMKLYGNVEQPETVLLSRAQFRDAMAGSEYREALARMFATSTLLFVGCSLDGLLADLSILGLPEQSGRRHFAIAGVSGRDWQARVGQLHERYGVETVLCREEAIGAELPEFLETLARESGRLRQSPAPQSQAPTAKPERSPAGTRA